MVANCAQVSERPARPRALEINPDGLPAELRAIASWGVWAYIWKNDKWDKPPQAPDDRAATINEGLKRPKGSLVAARANDAGTWGTFADASASCCRPGRDGVGFRLTPADGYLVIDIDGCVRADGTIEPWALAIVRAIGSYVEMSVSGTGLHIVVRARWPWPEEKGSRSYVVGGVINHASDAGHTSAKIELLAYNRYVCMTGRTPPGLPAQIVEAQEAVDALYSWLESQSARSTRTATIGHAPASDGVTSPPMTDQEVILRARNAGNGAGDRFVALHDRGDLSGQGEDHSAADFALCRLLAYWTQDAAQISRIVVGSKLYRLKWDERRGGETYGALTVAKALAATAEHYTGDGGDAERDRERESPPVSGDGDEVAALKRQLAEKTAECEQWQQGYARLEALLMTPALTESAKKALVHHLGRHGCTFGLPLPTVTWFSYFAPEDYADAPVSESSYRAANDIFAELGLFESRPHVSGETGNQYRDWRPVPAGVERFMAQLEAGDVAPPSRQEQKRENRREKERKEKAQQEAREARHRQEAAALRQVAYERDRARREADEREQALDAARREAAERRRALDEAQHVIAVHQRSDRLACRGCGTKIDVEQWRCDECRDRQREQQHEHEHEQTAAVATSNGNGHGLVVDVTSLDTYPQVVAGGGLLVNVTNNPPEAAGALSDEEQRGPPGYRDAPEAVARGACTPCVVCKGSDLYMVDDRYFCHACWPDPWEAARSGSERRVSS